MDYMIADPKTKKTKYYPKPIDPLIPESSETFLKDLSDAIQYNKNRIKEITTEYNTIFTQFTKSSITMDKKRLHERMQELSTEKIRLITHMRNLQVQFSDIRKAINEYKYVPCNSCSNKNITFRNPLESWRTQEYGGTKKRRKKSNKKKSNKKKSNKKKRNNRTYRR